MGTGQQADRTVFDIRVQLDMDSWRGRHGDVTSLLVLPREDSVMAYDGYIVSLWVILTHRDNMLALD